MIQLLESPWLIGITFFFGVVHIVRTRGLSDPGNVVISLCRNHEKLFFSPKFSREAWLWFLSYELLPHLVVQKQVKAFKMRWSDVREIKTCRDRLQVDALGSSYSLKYSTFLTKRSMTLRRRSFNECLLSKLGESHTQ